MKWRINDPPCADKHNRSAGNWFLLPTSLGKMFLPPIGRLDSPCCTELTALAVVGQDSVDATARGCSIGAAKKGSETWKTIPAQQQSMFRFSG
eukprot:6208517-Pleurochrysis_carterae.AAC.1